LQIRHDQFTAGPACSNRQHCASVKNVSKPKKIGGQAKPAASTIDLPFDEVMRRLVKVKPDRQTDQATQVIQAGPSNRPEIAH
jgi:hypothetical protein